MQYIWRQSSAVIGGSGSPINLMLGNYMLRNIIDLLKFI